MNEKQDFNPFIPLPDVQGLDGRQEFILQKSKGKNVLHLGCVDTGLMKARFQKGELMHQRLDAIATDLWGLDINDEGISFLKENGFDQLLVGDVCKLDEVNSLKNKDFDVILATEVVEHLQNPGMFLQSVQSVMKPDATELIITVPNAFRVTSLWWMLRKVEHVHPDHNYWFSYHTITTLIQKNGLDIRNLYMYSFPSNRPTWKHIKKKLNASPTNSASEKSMQSDNQSQSSLKRWINYIKMIPYWMFASWLLRKTPFFGDGLIVVCIKPTE